MPDGGLDVFRFGSSASPKLGCFHRPEVGAASRRTAVVLCPPLGHETIRSHRAYRRLAGELAAAGHAVLRFDLTGTGDSAGGEELWGLETWTADVVDAMDEVLRRGSGASSLCLVGGRLGAALAVRAADRRRDVAALVLWDSLFSGRDALAELAAEHRRVVSTAHVSRKARAGASGDMEFLGFELSASFRRELEAMEVAVPAGDSPAVLQVATTSFPESESPWMWMEDVARAVLPVRVVREITSWVRARCP
ncbi:MAG: alpha/beta fold hydrolase [Candidatus Eiseniibacteriota bacterium]